MGCCRFSIYIIPWYTVWMCSSSLFLYTERDKKTTSKNVKWEIWGSTSKTTTTIFTKKLSCNLLACKTLTFFELCTERLCQILTELEVFQNADFLSSKIAMWSAKMLFEVVKNGHSNWCEIHKFLNEIGT